MRNKHGLLRGEKRAAEYIFEQHHDPDKAIAVSSRHTYKVLLLAFRCFETVYQFRKH